MSSQRTPTIRQRPRTSSAAKAIGLGRLRVHVVVREHALAPSKLPEEASRLGDDTLGDDCWCLVKVEPSDRPTVRETHGIDMAAAAERLRQKRAAMRAVAVCEKRALSQNGLS
eukprot:CAMPEP_0117514538 /NCGR_PEP_ID=MMETSP0784-20121206/30121_1 /TAXON_ID=39447 /ORGANISM="" /LENGTH=112 /DNA_ID=CAMNT_0005310337 /DNA_START=178 /DNA_END=515 /DNA_ORIENTATION=-